MPYYGAEWITTNSTVPSKVDKFYAHPTYSDIEHIYIDSLDLQVNYDEQSATNYFTFRDMSHQLRQVWFDNSRSLASKYDWIKRNHLSGVGIWALGYDHGDTELWELLATSFGQER